MRFQIKQLKFQTEGHNKLIQESDNVVKQNEKQYDQIKKLQIKLQELDEERSKEV